MRERESEIERGRERGAEEKRRRENIKRSRKVEL